MEPETKEQTAIAQLGLQKDILLHQVEYLLSEKSGLDSKLRAFEHFIQRLTTNQVQATLPPNTSQPPPGPFGIRGSAEPTPRPSGYCGFSVKSSNLPTYEGKWTLDDVTAFLCALERHFKNAAQAIGWVGTTGWGVQAVLQLKGDAAVWAMHRLPMSTPIEWSTFCTELKAKYKPSDALDLVKCEWEELCLNKGECVTEFNERFHHLRSKLDPHQPMPAGMFADTYMYKIEKGTQGVYKDLVCYIGMHNRTPTLEQRMEHLTALVMFLNKSQPGSGSNMNTNTTKKASTRKMDFKKGGTTGAAGRAKDDGLTCYNCGQVGHISHNCPNRNLMKKLLEQALVGQDAPKAKSRCPRKDMKSGGSHNGRKESGQLAQEK